jgi:uncharacterized membrane protein
MNRGLHWTNLGVVATTALLPFLTSVVSTAIEDGNRADSQVAVALYALIGALLCVSWWVFFHYLARQPELTEDHVDDSFFGKERHRAETGVLLYAGSYPSLRVSYRGFPVLPLPLPTIVMAARGSSDGPASGTRVAAIAAQEDEVSLSRRACPTG